LIDNAIKYTPEGGRVQVGLEALDAHATIGVTDSGIGILESDQPHIFDRFWRADKVRSRGVGGAGLGLSIARWIVDQHQGSLEVRSRLSQGSTFTVKIPWPAVRAWLRLFESHLLCEIGVEHSNHASYHFGQMMLAKPKAP
jgi:signal transduction histidine kinase